MGDTTLIERLGVVLGGVVLGIGLLIMVRVGLPALEDAIDAYRAKLAYVACVQRVFTPEEVRYWVANGSARDLDPGVRCAQ